MGQIQNSLNQLFASGIGASLAVSHSPYFQAQRGIRQAEQTVKIFDRAGEKLLGKPNETTGKREGGRLQSIMDSIDKAESMDELKGMLKTDLPKFYEHLTNYISKGEKADIELARAQTHEGATKKQQAQGREKLVGYDVFLSGPTSIERRTGKIMRQIGEAYMKKRTLLKAVPDRTQMIEDFTNYKGGGTV